MSAASVVESINPKVTAATAACAAVQLIVGLTEWLAVVDVPTSVELPATIIATFIAGYMKSDNRKGKYEA